MAMLLIQILIFSVVWLFMGGVLYLALRFVRTVERRGLSSGELPALGDRLASVEEALGRTAAQVERLEVGQQFIQRLLSEQSTRTPTAS